MTEGTIGRGDTLLIMGKGAAALLVLSVALNGIVAVVEGGVQPSLPSTPTVFISEYQPTATLETPLPPTPEPTAEIQLECDQYDPENGKGVLEIWEELGKPESLYIKSPDAVIINIEPYGDFTFAIKKDAEICSNVK